MATLKQIDHFVLLMLENRSFDNVLGKLYPKSDDFDGLSGNESNPDGRGGSVRVWHGAGDRLGMRLPTPDPGELFSDMSQQLFGDGAVQGAPSMSGFAMNYARNGGNPWDIMHGFTPEQLPALSALARSYAVCDRWHAAAPCQTFPNRFFVHTASAGGYENNTPLHFPYMMETIFNRLEGQAPHGWNIYFHDFPQSLMLTRLWDHQTHFHPIEQFHADCARGTLPSYSFIEPRYFADSDWPSDMHPPHDVVYGDRLIARIHDALRASPCWPASMLVILFDEHGGNYDHVPPPAAVAPELPKPGQVFAFDRLGVRIPAVVVSPWIRPGTRFRAPPGQAYDHTAIIKTLRKRFMLDAPLSARDAAAPDLEQVLNLDAPSDLGRLDVRALEAPAGDDAAALARARMAPLNDLQSTLHSAAAHLAPLGQAGGSIASHVEALMHGWRPAAMAAANVGQAASFVAQVLHEMGIRRV